MDYAKIACNVSNVNNLSKFIKNSKKNYKKVAKLITIPTTQDQDRKLLLELWFILIRSNILWKEKKLYLMIIS